MLIWIAIAGVVFGALLGAMAGLVSARGVTMEQGILKVHAGSVRDVLALVEGMTKIGNDAVQKQILARGVAAQAVQPQQRTM